MVFYAHYHVLLHGQKDVLAVYGRVSESDLCLNVLNVLHPPSYHVPFRFNLHALCRLVHSVHHHLCLYNLLIYANLVISFANHSVVISSALWISLVLSSKLIISQLWFLFFDRTVLKV